MPASLRGRLVLAATLFTLVVLAVTLGVMNHLLERFVAGQIDQRLDNKIVALAAQVRVAADGSISLQGDADGPPFDEPHHQSFWMVAGPKNAVQSRWLKPDAFKPPGIREIAEAPGPPPPPLGGPPPPDSGRAGPHPRTLRVQGPNNVAVHLRAIVRDIDGTQVALMAAAPLKAIKDPVGEAMRTVGVTILILGAASLAAAFAFARLVLQPLSRMRAEIGDVRVGRRTMLSPVQPTEIQPLVDELNALLAQNAANLARARKHVANLAHGLKTPLATLSLALRRLDAEDAPKLQSLADAIERRVRHHLGRARAAALDGPVRSQTLLAPRLTDIVGALQKIHADRRIAVTLACPPDATLACEPQDVDEILGNLLDNAFKYTRTSVTCDVRTQDRTVVIEITDDGPGLSPDEVARVLRPGQRLDEDIPGFGFGLPIARELVELYAGDLKLEPQAAGLKVSLTLPRAL